MKRVSLLLIILFTIIGLMQGAEYSTATKLFDKEPVPDTDLTWTLYGDGVFVIEGEGDIPEYDPFAENVVWYWRINYGNGISKIILEEGVKSIGNLTFLQYSNLTEVVIPNSVTSIGNSAFAYCEKLATIIIGNSLKTIGKDAFFKCSKLASINLPKTVESIGSEAFEYCYELTAINVDADNPNFTSIDGVLYNKDVSKLLVYPAGKTGEYIFPETVTVINEYGFSTCQGLTSITIPETITEIGDFTFFECSNLTEIHLPNTITKIGNSVFRRTKSLETIIFPNSVAEMGISVFGAAGIEYITFPTSITAIPTYAFELCANLTAVALPNSINSIGNEAFYECNNLTSLLIDSDKPPVLNGNPFAGITNKSNITIYVPAGMEANYAGSPWNTFKEVKGVDMDAIFGIAEHAALAPAGETKSVEINTEGDVYDLFTSMNLACRAEIPEEAADWLSATVEDGYLKLTATANHSGAARSTTVTLWLVSERNAHEITVSQAENTVSAVAESALEGIRITGGNAAILIQNAQGMKLTVADMLGRVIYSGAGANSVNIPAAQGLYVVKADGDAVKVLVK